MALYMLHIHVNKQEVKMNGFKVDVPTITGLISKIVNSEELHSVWLTSTIVHMGTTLY